MIAPFFAAFSLMLLCAFVLIWLDFGRPDFEIIIGALGLAGEVFRTTWYGLLFYSLLITSVFLWQKWSIGLWPSLIFGAITGLFALAVCLAAVPLIWGMDAFEGAQSRDWILSAVICF
ncbi:MAG: hypothetical protein AAF585_23740, partial [Verrucomicrobiota bacterium]